MARRALITGASGFLGRAVAARLRTDGWQTRGVDLRDDPAAAVVAADVGHEGVWQDHASGCDLVVHTAAVVSMRLERPAEVWRANVLGTKHALDAAARNGVRRFVHFSSVAVFGFDFPDGVDERHPVRPTGVPYADTKIAGEQVVLQAHAEGRVDAAIVRPGDVYGPGARAWATLPVEHMRARRFLLPRGGRGIFSPVYVDDLVAGVVAAATHDDASGQVFTLSGGVGVPTREFFGHYAGALGQRIPTAPLPVARGAARAGRLLGRLRPGDTDVNAHAITFLDRRGTYAIGKARDVLGWAPRVGLDEGMPRTLAWLRAEGALPPLP